MRFPRFRIRTLMIIVAIAAFGLGGWALWKRAVGYWSRAQEAAAHEQLARQMEAIYQQQSLLWKRLSLSQAGISAALARGERRLRAAPGGLPFDSAVFDNRSLHYSHNAIEDRDKLREAAKEAERYARLRVKYERAARYPWLPLAPDPPPPE